MIITSIKNKLGFGLELGLLELSARPIYKTSTSSKIRKSYNIMNLSLTYRIAVMEKTELGFRFARSFSDLEMTQMGLVIILSL